MNDKKNFFTQLSEIGTIEGVNLLRDLHDVTCIIYGFQYTPLVEKANEDLVHHMILYECASTSTILSPQTKLAGAPCYSSRSPMPTEWETCMQPVLAWARGSKGELSTKRRQSLEITDSPWRLFWRAAIS